MPYKNVPEEKWGKMDSCVQDVLNAHKGEEGFTKENAIGICYNRIVGSTDVAIEPADVHFEVVTDPTEVNMVLGQSFEPGELLRWKNAELARAEVNANMDELSNDDIGTLAATLPLMPLTNEHGEIIGLFTAATSEDAPGFPSKKRLLTEGIMYRRRFPDVADEIMNGTKRLSIEAIADMAVCSLCGGEFPHMRAYCSHLKNRHATGASRRFKGIRAVGGGAVRRPAGSSTGFDRRQVYMVASHQESDDAMDELSERLLLWYAAGDFVEEDMPDDLIEAAKKKWAQDVDLDEGSLKALGWPSGEKIASAIKSGKVSYAKAIRKLAYLANVSKDSATKSKAKSIMSMLKSRFRGGNKSEGGDTSMEREEIQNQLDKALSDLESLRAEHEGVQTERDELVEQVASLKASVEELEGQLATEKEGREQAQAEIAWKERSALLAFIGEEELERQKDTIMAMSDEAVSLFMSAARNTTQPPAGATMTANLEDDGDKVTVTLS